MFRWITFFLKAFWYLCYYWLIGQILISKLKKKGRGARVKHLLCTRPNQIQFLLFNMVPKAPPGVIPEKRVRSNPWALSGLFQQQKMLIRALNWTANILNYVHLMCIIILQSSPQLLYQIFHLGTLHFWNAPLNFLDSGTVLKLSVTTQLYITKPLQSMHLIRVCLF